MNEKSTTLGLSINELNITHDLGSSMDELA
jgi:hypothetical protein